MSSKTLTIKRVEEREISFKDWFPMVKGDFLTEQHAINKWEAMCEMMRDSDCGYSEYCDSSEMELEECEDALVSIAEDTDDVEDECERCGLISESNIVHSFGCVELCEKCSTEGDQPQCPRKHADSEGDPCEWCSEEWAKMMGHCFIKVEWDIDEGEEGCCGGCGKSAPPPYLKIPYMDDEEVPDYLSKEHGWCVKNWKTVPEEDVIKWIERRASPEEVAAEEAKVAAAKAKEAEMEKEREEVAMLMRMVRAKAAKAGIKLKIEEE